MTKRPRYPFIALGVTLVLILLFAFGPMLVLLIGGGVGDALGCRLPINGPTGQCLYMGIDFTGFLAFAVLCGYLSFATFPTGIPLLGVWLVVAVIVTLIWGLRRWRANSKPVGPEDSSRPTTEE